MIWIKCKKNLYCDKVKDVCFVEMQPPKSGKNLSDLVPKVTLNCAPVKKGAASVIGNSNCFGLQAGEGKMKDQIINKSSPLNGLFEHHVPTTGGALLGPRCLMPLVKLWELTIATPVKSLTSL